MWFEVGFIMLVCALSVHAACPNGGATGSNMVTNGGFESGSSGWIISAGGVEIGNGGSYNPNWNSGNVVELDYYVNERVSQSLTLSAADYILRFDYAARVGISFETNAFAIYWNGVLIQTVVPTDYNKNVYEVVVTALEGSNTFGIEGAGAGEGVGMTIDNVQFYATVYWHYIVVDSSCVCLNGYYAPSNAAQCLLCSTQFASCNQCSLGACSTCATGFHSTTCEACDTIEAHCTTCTQDGSTCSTCDTANGYFMDTLNNDNADSCQPCILTGCTTCSTLYTCQTCDTGSNYFLNSFQTCTLCTISNCLSCASLSACATCDTASGYYLNSTSNYCQECSITGCVTCSALTVCAACDSSANYYRPSTSTVCAYCNNARNDFINGSGDCQSCSLLGCRKCASLTTCEVCDTSNDYKLNPNTNLCEQCPIDNCIVCASPTICSQCDSDNFYGLSAAGTGCSTCETSCTCSGYSLPYISGACSSTCGDGYLANEQCDDGNLQDSDGCSHLCQIEDRYVCKKERDEAFSVTPNPSICSINQFSVSLFTWHALSPFFCDDKIVFELQFSPAPPSMTNFYSSLIDYESVITVNISGLLFVSHEYLPDNGTVLLVYSYNLDLHGQHVLLHFNTSAVPQLSSYEEHEEVVHFVKQAHPVVVHEEGACSEVDSMFSNLGLIFGGIAYGLLVLSIFLKGKLVVLQLLGVIQVSYFSLANAAFIHELLIPVRKLKDMVIGYNVEMSQSMYFPDDYLDGNQEISYRVEGMGYTSHTTLNFFANVNVMLILLLFLPFLALLLKMAASSCEKLLTVSKHVLKEAFISLVILCAMGIGFMAGLHFKYQRGYYQSYTETHPPDYNLKMTYLYGNLATMTAITIIFSACVLLQLSPEEEGFGQYRSVLNKNNESAAIIYPVTIGFRFLLGLLMAALSNSDSGNIVTLILVSLMILLVALLRPQKKNLLFAHTLSTHTCMLTIIILRLYFSEATPNMAMSEKSQNLGPGVTEWVIIGGCVIFSMVILGIELGKRVMKWRKKQKLRSFVYGEESNNSNAVIPDGAGAQNLPDENVSGEYN